MPEATSNINPIYKDLEQLFSGMEICYSARRWLRTTPMTKPEQAWSKCPRGEWLAYMVYTTLLNNNIFEVPDTVCDALEPMILKIYKESRVAGGYHIPEDEDIKDKFSRYYNRLEGMFDYVMGGYLRDTKSLALARTIRKHMTIIQEDGNLRVVWRHPHTLTPTPGNVSGYVPVPIPEDSSTIF